MCAHAVRVAVRKIDGVDSVAVSLKEGTASIWLAPTNSVTLGQVRHAIRNNGFTPKEAEIKASGRVVQRGEGFFLEMGEGRGLMLQASAGTLRGELERAVGKRMSLAGVAPESSRDEAGPFRLTVTQVQPTP